MGVLYMERAGVGYSKLHIKILAVYSIIVELTVVHQHIC